jgi:hypothetical protein
MRILMVDSRTGEDSDYYTGDNVEDYPDFVILYPIDVSRYRR